MLGDPKVVVALALAILVLPPTVTAIMQKAAQQADASWLKDGDVNPSDRLNLKPPDDFQPPPGDSNRTPPTDAKGNVTVGPKPEDCKGTRDPATRTLAGPAGVGAEATSHLDYKTQPGDIALGIAIVGHRVTGTPAFQLSEGTRSRWQSADQVVQQDVQLPRQDQQMYPVRPGVTWSLTWDLTNVLYSDFTFALQARTCEVPR